MKRLLSSEARDQVVSRLDTARYVALAGIIAAAYASTTIAINMVVGTLSWGPIQVRPSEALCALALLTPAAAPGLTLGCAIANLANIAFAGTGVLGLLDVVFGSLATFIASYLAWKFHKHPVIGLLAFVVANSLIIPLYLPILLKGIGFYTIPFTSISLDDNWGFMYLFGVISCAVSEGLVLFLLGLPLFRKLASTRAGQRLIEEGEARA